MLTRLCLFISLFLCVAVDGSAQSIIPKTFDSSAYDLTELKAKYGHNKELLPGFEMQALLALSQFPELSNEQIAFRYRHINSTCKTNIRFTVFNRHQRLYIIYVNSNANGKYVLLPQASFNAQVGVIAHELNHIIEFKTLDVHNLVFWGLKYFNRHKRAECEKHIDEMTIAKGFGWQSYEWISYVMTQANVPDIYKRFKKRYYLTPVEVVALINLYGSFAFDKGD